MKINYEDFKKINLRVGTIISVNKNKKAHKPALVLEIDFGGKIGIKISSAQITDYYNKNNLLGKQIIAVCNFHAKNIAGITSEVLVLGVVDSNRKVILIQPSQNVENGLEIY